MVLVLLVLGCHAVLYQQTWNYTIDTFPIACFHLEFGVDEGN